MKSSTKPHPHPPSEKETADGLPQPDAGDGQTKEPPKNKGGRPKGRTRTYDIRTYTKPQDAINALNVLREKIKAGDRQAAQYLLDQMFGTAVNRRENVGDETKKGLTVIIAMPPKFSELAQEAGYRLVEPAKLKQKDGETPAPVSKPTRNDEVGGSKSTKATRAAK